MRLRQAFRNIVSIKCFFCAPLELIQHRVYKKEMLVGDQTLVNQERRS